MQQNLQQRQAHTLAETSGYDTDNGGIVESDYGKSDRETGCADYD